MRTYISRSSLSVLATLTIIFSSHLSVPSHQTPPHVPNAGTTTPAVLSVASTTPPTPPAIPTTPTPQPAAPAPAPTPAPTTPDYPVRLIIPAIGLSDPVEGVGTTANGEMAVPPGNSNYVGWYDQGALPGDIGSAVIDAHVFAAFGKLHLLTPGEDIYVLMHSGQKLHFVIQEKDYYLLSQIPLDALFNRADTARLNLITCAGKLIPDKSTYDHRLVIYAELAAS